MAQSSLGAPESAPRQTPRPLDQHEAAGTDPRARILAAFALALAAAGCAPAAPASTPAKKYEAPDERFVFFPVARTEALPDGFFSIGYVAALLDADAALRVLVVGHADPQGRAEANRELSFKRARAVRKVLVEHGIKESRIVIAAPREESERALAQLARRADLFVYDPAQDDASKRIGYPVEIRGE
jgi:outer membrane protein OmpA-like peptidoglycan-associated protein